MVAPQARRRAATAAHEETVVLDPEGTSVSLLVDEDEPDDVYLVDDDDVFDELDDVDVLDEPDDEAEVAATSARHVRVAPVEPSFIDLDDEEVDVSPAPERPSAVRALDPEIADLVGWFVHELSHAPRRPQARSRVSPALPIARGRVSASTPSAGRGPTRR